MVDGNYFYRFSLIIQAKYYWKLQAKNHIWTMSKHLSGTYGKAQTNELKLQRVILPLECDQRIFKMVL